MERLEGKGKNVKEGKRDTKMVGRKEGREGGRQKKEHVRQKKES